MVFWYPKKSVIKSKGSEVKDAEQSSYYLQFVSIRMTTIRLLKGTPSTTHFNFLQWKIDYTLFLFSVD